MKGRIAVISMGYMWFPCEAGPSRLYEIAQRFQESEYSVEVITTGFQHFKKEKRDKELILDQGYPFKITFIDAPAYKKNIDLRRVYSNYILAKNVKKYLVNHITEYNAVYVTIPANDIAAEVTTLCRKAVVPVIVDVEDLWPEAMAMVIKSEVLRKMILHKFWRDAEITYSNADGIVGTSDDYTERAFVKRKKDIPAITVYVGCNLKDFDEGVKKYENTIVKPAGQFWVTYAGSISTSYDIETLILAAKILKQNKKDDIKIQILGTGSDRERLENFIRINNMDNVIFWGYVQYPMMAAVLSKSDILVNSFVKGAPQSIVNKIGDYLAAGKPMINTLENPIFYRMVEQYGIGINVEPENSELLCKVIEVLSADPIMCYDMGKNARKLAEEKFDRGVSYQKIIDIFEMIEKNYRDVELKDKICKSGCCGRDYTE